MPTAADRNLLFGILAFISRDQLVEAMHAWMLAKQQPLGDILVERGALAPADHALLAPLSPWRGSGAERTRPCTGGRAAQGGSGRPG
jgi:hypothetical protein